MTDEQLTSLINEISAEFERLPKEEAKMSKEQRQQRLMLLTRKGLLLHVKNARTKGNASEETRHLAMYSAFTTYGHRNPLLVNLFMGKFRGGGMI